VSKNHPVWDVYDQLRTVRLNEKYYGKRLQKYEQINFVSEIIVAATSSSSAIASFAYWNTDKGGDIWKFMLIISALIATAKPLLNLTKRIRAYEELLAGYRLLCHDLKDLKIDISQTRTYSKSHQTKFKKIIEKQRVLVAKSPERTEDKTVKETCFDEVSLEYPKENFYIPEM